MLLIHEVYTIVRIFTLSSVIRAVGYDSLTLVPFVIDTIGTLFTAAGVGLLIWAVVARRTPRQQPAWQQPQPQYGWQQQPQQPQQPQPQQPGWQPQSPPQPPPGQQPGRQDPERPGWQNPQG